MSQPVQQEDRQEDVLDGHPGRIAEWDGEDAHEWHQQRRRNDDDAQADERRDDLADRVVGRVQAARQRVGQ